MTEILKGRAPKKNAGAAGLTPAAPGAAELVTASEPFSGSSQPSTVRTFSTFTATSWAASANLGRHSRRSHLSSCERFAAFLGYGVESKI